jgi:hypothetical protein
MKTDRKQPCAVYRAYDTTSELLYVGIAFDWGARWAQHAERSPFFSIVAHLEVSWFPSRTHARAEELRLIADHNPPFNSRGRTDEEAEGGDLHLVCFGCGIGIAVTKESLSDFWKRSCVQVAQAWPAAAKQFASGTAQRCTEQLTLKRLRPETLGCSKCGCLYGGSAESFDYMFKWESGPCRDWRCHCGAADCYPQHACDGVLRRQGDIPNLRELQVRARLQDEAPR